MRPAYYAVLLALVVAVPLGGAAYSAAEQTKQAYTIATRAADSRHEDIEALFGRGDYRGERRLAEARLKTNPDDPELYIHLFRAMFEEAEAHGRDDPNFDKVARYEAMLDLVDKGLKLAPQHPRLLWGKGIALARLGTTRGVLSSLFSAKEIERTWEKVVESGYKYRSYNDLEVLPCDAQLALGIFYRLVPDWWVVKVVAGTRGDLDRALTLMRASEACAPGRVRSKKELGVAELCFADKRGDAGARARGEKALRAVAAMPAPREIDKIDVRHSKWLLAHPEEACGYSRDGQQKLDESALKK